MASDGTISRMAVAADGCPVEVYARMPAEPELPIVLDLISGARTVLDLGAGAGRIANPLQKAGFYVTAVDESAAMLAAVRAASTQCSRIEDLELDDRFDAVLLLSQLINTPDLTRRADLMAAAARHLADDGLVVLQRLNPTIQLQAGRGTAVDIELLNVRTDRWPEISAVTRYRVDGQRWDQPWSARILNDTDTAAVLSAAGLRPVTLDGAWVTARHLH